MSDFNGGVAAVGRSVQGGAAAGEGPRSRAKEIAARGDAPTAASLGALVHAAVLDRLTGGLESPEARDTYAGVRTFAAVAKASGAINELAAEIDSAERDRKARRRAELLAELAEIEGTEPSRPLPPKG